MTRKEATLLMLAIAKSGKYTPRYKSKNLPCLSPKLLNEKGPLQGSDGIRHPSPENRIDYG